MVKLIDVERLLAAMRSATNNPCTAELVIMQLEQGHFDAPAADQKKRKTADASPAE